MSDSFGQKVRTLRIHRKLTLDELAELIGSKKSYVWQLENKRPARPSGELLLKLATALHTSPDFLLDDGQTEPSDNQMANALLRKVASSKLSTKDIETLIEIADGLKSREAPEGSN